MKNTPSFTLSNYRKNEKNKLKLILNITNINKICKIKLVKSQATLNKKITMLEKICIDFINAYTSSDKNYFANSQNQKILKLLFSFKEPIKSDDLNVLASVFWGIPKDNDDINKLILLNCRSEGFYKTSHKAINSLECGKNNILAFFLINAWANIPKEGGSEHKLMEKNLEYIV